MNLADLLVAAARERPDHPAVVYERRRYTYAELDEYTSRFASAVEDLGAGPGTVVAVDLYSTPELVITYFGALRAGMVANVINAMLKEEEVRYILNDSQAQVLVTDAAHYDALAGLRPELKALKHIVVVDGERPGAIRFDSLLKRGRGRYQPRDVEPHTLGNLLYTSGTTGFPKGVMLSHLNLTDNAVNFAGIHYGPDDTVAIGSPLFHCWGLINGVSSTFHARGTAAFLHRFQTDKALDLIESCRATIFHGVPTMYNYMTKSPAARQGVLRSIRFVLSAAASMPVELIETLRRDFGIEYAEAYGLTETSPVITTAPFSSTRIGSCGRAMGDTRLKVVGADGREVPAGEVGELWAHGTAIMLGYLNKPEATRQVLDEDGWFRTGDMVRMDAEGYVYIVDRLKDMINVGGLKVYPREVEEVLYTHPKIADVAVVGVPDPDRGEVPKAIVVPRAGQELEQEEVLDFCRRKMASYKVPRYVELAGDIPRSASGKILRRILKEQSQEG